MPPQATTVTAATSDLLAAILAAAQRHADAAGRTLDVPGLLAWLATDLPSVVASFAKLFVIITS